MNASTVLEAERSTGFDSWVTVGKLAIPEAGDRKPQPVESIRGNNGEIITPTESGQRKKRKKR